mmetsp:Transcript_26668/g.61343  ORF Transcript_26668/g.61343 Transcript_26668/m.61343 type:complete len:210 (+) Transcript_26668:884-1513(+)
MSVFLFFFVSVFHVDEQTDLFLLFMLFVGRSSHDGELTFRNFLPHLLGLLAIHFDSPFERVVSGERQQHHQHERQKRLRQHFVQKSADERARDGQRLHHQDQVPVHQRPVHQRMPLRKIQQAVRAGAPEHRHVRQRNGLFRREPQHQNVDGHQDAAPADSAAGGDHQAQGRAQEAPPVAALQRKQGRVHVLEQQAVEGRAGAARPEIRP